MPKRKRPLPPHQVRAIREAENWQDPSLSPEEQRVADAAAREALLTEEQRARLAAAREQAAAEYAHLFDEKGHLVPRRLREAPTPRPSSEIEDELRDLL